MQRQNDEQTSKHPKCWSESFSYIGKKKKKNHVNSVLGIGIFDTASFTFHRVKETNTVLWGLSFATSKDKVKEQQNF